jgi:hypothetical protein
MRSGGRWGCGGRGRRGATDEGRSQRGARAAAPRARALSLAQGRCPRLLPPTHTWKNTALGSSMVYVLSMRWSAMMGTPGGGEGGYG